MASCLVVWVPVQLHIPSSHHEAHHLPGGSELRVEPELDQLPAVGAYSFPVSVFALVDKCATATIISAAFVRPCVYLSGHPPVVGVRQQGFKY